MVNNNKKDKRKRSESGSARAEMKKRREDAKNLQKINSFFSRSGRFEC